MKACKSQPSPWAPLVELYRLGCRPIGYVRAADGGYEFVVYAPARRAVYAPARRAVQS